MSLLIVMTFAVEGPIFLGNDKLMIIHLTQTFPLLIFFSHIAVFGAYTMMTVRTHLSLMKRNGDYSILCKSIDKFTNNFDNGRKAEAGRFDPTSIRRGTQKGVLGLFGFLGL